jgi:hypothetical protein
MCSSAVEEIVVSFVPFPDADIFAAGEESIAALEGVDQGRGGQPGSPVAQVLEHEALERNTVGEALECEGLDDQLRRADFVKAPAEPAFEAVAHHQEAVRPTGAAIETIDSRLIPVGPVPLDEEVRVGMGPEHLLGRASNSLMIRTSGTSDSAMI